MQLYLTIMAIFLVLFNNSFIPGHHLTIVWLKEFELSHTLQFLFCRRKYQLLSLFITNSIYIVLETLFINRISYNQKL